MIMQMILTSWEPRRVVHLSICNPTSGVNQNHQYHYGSTSRH